MNKQLTILYVEDNDAEVELLLLCIERYNLDTTIILDVAETVTEAKTMFDTDKHAAALIDWNLPDGEGTDVARHIRDKDGALPIIFLSGALTTQHLHEAEKYTPKACLEKNYSQHFIEKIIQLIIL